MRQLGEMCRRGQVGRVSPVIQLVLHLCDFDQNVQVLLLPLRFVADQRAVEMHSENNEHQGKGHHDGGRGDRCSFPRAYPWRISYILCRARNFNFILQREELHPAEKNHLCKKEEGAYDGGEGPGQLDVEVHPLVWRLLY